MKLLFLGKELDSSKEIEILHDQTKNAEKFGFKVTVQYNENSWYTNKNEINNNVTEVHHLFNKIPIMGAERRIAFESDIHYTGLHRDCDDILCVNIELANEISEKF